MKLPVFIFSSWPYISGELHLGRLIGSFIPADSYRRLLRLSNLPVFHCSGLDCHGEKGIENIEETSRKTKLEHLHIFKKLAIVLDLYDSTINKKFQEYAYKKIKKLSEEGTIFLKSVLIPYCTSCKTEVRQITKEKGKSYCSFCHSNNLRTIITDKRQNRWVLKSIYNNKYYEVERENNSKGLASPLSTNKKIWVWIEALNGYGFLYTKMVKKLKFSKINNFELATENHFFYGEDNLPFHKGILPVILPRRLFYHHTSKHLYLENRKMSGSENHYFKVQDFEKKDLPILRLFLISFNLTRRPKNFDKNAYSTFKKWVKTRLVHNWQDWSSTTEEAGYSNQLLKIYQNEGSFSHIFLLLQKKISQFYKHNKIEDSRKIKTILKILSPDLLTQ